MRSHAGLDADPRPRFGRPGRVPARGRRRRRGGGRAAGPGAEHVDRTDGPFVTLDPATVDRPRPGVRHRAGGRRPRPALRHRRRRLLRRPRRARSTTRRGGAASPSTCPTSESPLYPAALSEGGGEPAARRASPGRRVHRARRPRRRCRASTASSGRWSTAGPSWPTRTSTTATLPPGFAELAAAHRRAEERRGAPRVEFPEQELERVDGGWALRFEPRLESEDRNAAMSLATNLAVAEALLAAGTGLFRVMADAPTSAPCDGCATRRGRSGSTGRTSSRSPTSSARCRATTRAAAAFLIAVRRAGGGASLRSRSRRRRQAVARGDGGDVRPRHRAAAPARRPLRRRGGARRRQRRGRARPTSRPRSPSCRR